MSPHAPAPARLPDLVPANSSPVLTERWRACWEGIEPAESLDTTERELLVAFLVEARLTDRVIAAHTRMTLYTTARIRQRLELDPVPESVGHGAALLTAHELVAMRERYRRGEPVHHLAQRYGLEVREVRSLVGNMLSPGDFEGGRIPSSRGAA